MVATMSNDDRTNLHMYSTCISTVTNKLSYDWFEIVAYDFYFLMYKLKEAHVSCQ